jgi:hypothetical protein
MAKRQFRRNGSLAALDFPDWAFLERVVELFTPYTQGEEVEGNLRLDGEDNRGTYSEPTIEDLQVEIERRGESPNRISVWVSGWEHGDGLASRDLAVHAEPHSTRYSLQSGREEVVVLLEERIRALVSQAERERRERKAARWQKLLRQPNPWVVIIVGTAIATIVAGVVLALVLT